MTDVAFIGVGNMGGPMATNLVKAGIAVKAFDLSSDAVEKVVSDGATAAASIAEAVHGADVVITMLPAGKHVVSVYEGDVIGNAKSDALFIDCSTIDVASARRVNEAAAQKGFEMVDAPVSGGIMGAAAGTLTFMCGGSDPAFDRAKPLLDIMGKTIIHAGGAGNGQAAKICNNMMLGIQMISVCEAFNLAEKLGLDAQKLYDVSSTASGQCWSLTTYCPVPGPIPTSPANNDYKPGFSAAMMVKDLKLAQDAVQDVDGNTPLGAKAAALYEQFCESGGEGTDFSGIIQMLKG